MKILTTTLCALLTSYGAYSQYNLNFDPKHYEVQTLTLEGKTITVRAYENIVYVAKPVDTVYQKMNIYIPEAYFNGKSINGYTAATAPIFLPNNIGGYMPATPGTAKPSNKPPMMPPNGKMPEGMPPMPANGTPPAGMPPFKQAPTILTALSKGYIVASPGARGRTNKDGKAPAAIVDLKAAVRYLKFNDKTMPGDANKIISNGTSAGGAMSSLLGATGDAADYHPYLKALGAADASDAIFAVSAYCPITNLENADMAYEWQFNILNTEKSTVSDDLKAAFPAYVNSLHLKDKNGHELSLDANGNGNFKDLVKSYIIASAQTALDNGVNLTQHAFLKIANKKVTDLDWDAYIHYMTRMKTPPAFDALNVSTGENQLFGTATTDKQHFTAYSAAHSAIDATTADATIVKMMNPMPYIGQAHTAKHWRIRHGAKDRDTGLAISVILATYLENQGIDVNLALPWDKPHSGDYDLDELFAWIDSIAK